ncbi:MAG: trypsin-like peptidase domain-containing protein [Ruminococcus sp.]|nr:trypsin-like peptidase domain-containing protein [Ruminococcus sp.]
MNEYNYNFEEVGGGYYNSEENPSPKKPKKNTALKVVASLMAMTLVSAGSIGVYRTVTEGRNADTATESSHISAENEEAAVNKEVSDVEKETSAAEILSTLQIEENDGKVLTTEEVVQKVMPSVVGIKSEFEMQQQNNYNYGNGFGGFGSFGDIFGFGGSGDGYGYGYGDGSQIQQENPIGTGTGVIFSEDGYIVTNAHVIYDSQNGLGLASEIEVLVNDNTYTAGVVGYDIDCDLAVLKIAAEGLVAAEFGDSDKLNLGEDVTAIGNPLGLDLMNTVTKGIVSGLNRNITINDKSMSLIQTDTAINSGNSGGPLINKYGQVIGINSSKMSSSGLGEASVEGICFAIPSNKVSDVVEDFMTYGYVKGKPQLGISCRDVTEDIAEMYGMPVGVYVIEVTEGSAAEKAGLKKSDIITAVDGVKVKTAEELTAQKNLHTAGDEIELTFMRNGEEMTIKLTLDEVTVPVE